MYYFRKKNDQVSYLAKIFAILSMKARSWQDGAKIWRFAHLHLATLGNNQNIFHNVWKSPERLWHGSEVLRFFNLVPRALFPGFASQGKAPWGRGCRFFSKIWVMWIQKSHTSLSKGRRYIIQWCGWSETKWSFRTGNNAITSLEPVPKVSKSKSYM